MPGGSPSCSSSPVIITTPGEQSQLYLKVQARPRKRKPPRLRNRVIPLREVQDQFFLDPVAPLFQYLAEHRSRHPCWGPDLHGLSRMDKNRDAGTATLVRNEIGDLPSFEGYGIHGGTATIHPEVRGNFHNPSCFPTRPARTGRPRGVPGSQSGTPGPAHRSLRLTTL